MRKRRVLKDARRETHFLLSGIPVDWATVAAKGRKRKTDNLLLNHVWMKFDLMARLRDVGDNLQIETANVFEQRGRCLPPMWIDILGTKRGKPDGTAATR
mmetsp:Transcript_5210/g.7256  ORF Transcript_5210/g.7256 Transcript_5210/m.7256 type:complete len:100 (-) Transcript_5210:182-481(-)